MVFCCWSVETSSQLQCEVTKYDSGSSHSLRGKKTLLISAAILVSGSVGITIHCLLVVFLHSISIVSAVPIMASITNLQIPTNCTFRVLIVLTKVTCQGLRRSFVMEEQKIIVTKYFVTDPVFIGSLHTHTTCGSVALVMSFVFVQTKS